MKASKTSLMTLVVSSAFLAGFANVASAQSMDYGSLEDLFGEPVTTSATGKPQRASEVPASMTIITAKEIKDSGMRTLPEILNRVTGVDVLQWAPTKADVGVRGYNQGYNPRLLVLLNGQQVYRDYYGMTLWSLIPVQLSEIRQIEVVKGPQSALFGFNAVSGVVNIVTYNPLYDQGGSVDVTLGTQGHREVNAYTAFKLGDRAGVRVSAGGWGVDPYDTERTPRLDRFYRNSASRRTAALDSLFQITPDVQAGVETSWGRTAEFAVTPNASTGWIVNESYTAIGRLKANSSLGVTEASYYYNQFDVGLTFTGGNVSTQTRTTIAQLQHLAKLTTNLTTRVGLEYRDNRIDSWPSKGAVTGYRNYAISNMYDFQLSPTWNVTGAARWDHTELYRDGPRPYPFTTDDYNRTFDSGSYNLGVVWRATPEDRILLVTGRGVGSPNLLELSNNILREPTSTLPSPVGNPYTDPSIITNYELSWRHQLDAIGGFAQLAVSHQETKDLRFVNLQARPNINGYTAILLGNNLGSSRAWALEAEVHGAFSNVHWNLSWVWMDTNDDITVSNSAIGQNYEKSNPRNTVKANVGWNKGPLSTDLLLIWKSDTSVYLNDGSGVKLLDASPGLTAQASVGYQITDSFRVSLTGANLLKEETQLTVAPKAERRVWATASLSF
jgi:iron complex outermembrane receptor protein